MAFKLAHSAAAFNRKQLKSTTTKVTNSVELAPEGFGKVKPDKGGDASEQNHANGPGTDVTFALHTQPHLSCSGPPCQAYHAEPCSHTRQESTRAMDTPHSRAWYAWHMQELHVLLLEEVQSSVCPSSCVLFAASLLSGVSVGSMQLPAQLVSGPIAFLCTKELQPQVVAQLEDEDVARLAKHADVQAR